MVNENYLPNKSVLDNLSQVTFVAVVGPTAVGKTTLMNAAAARCPALHPVLTTTTRMLREDEENDVDIHYRTPEEMKQRIAAGEYVQVAPSSLNGETYATAPEDYSTEGIAIMPVFADVVASFKALPFKAVRTVFVLPPSWEIWQERIVAHRFPAEAFEKRMVEAGRSLRYALDAQDLIFVVNDDLAQSTLDFTQAALGAASAANPYKSRDLAAKLLKELQNR
jgi:guanylate kinase